VQKRAPIALPESTAEGLPCLNLKAIVGKVTSVCPVRPKNFRPLEYALWTIFAASGLRLLKRAVVEKARVRWANHSACPAVQESSALMVK
jgi:hypothetical protein